MRRSVVLVVLPLRTPGGSGDDAAIAQGLLEDITGELSRFPTLQVLSWSAGVAVAELTDAEIRDRLGVTHVLRGSLRRQGPSFRISGHLVECASGTQIWGDRFDVPAEALFDLQEDVVARIAAALNVRIEQAALAEARRRPSDMTAYMLTLHGYHRLREGTFEADEAARALFQRAIELDPLFARPHAGIALSWLNEFSCQFWERFEETAGRAYATAHAALTLDDRDPYPHQILGKILLFRRDWEHASWYFDRALELCPSDPELLIAQSLYDAYLGRPEVGLLNAARAMRLNPYHPGYYPGIAAMVHLMAGDFATAAELAGRAEGPNFVDTAAFWAVTLAHLGRLDEARAHFAEFEKSFTEKILFGRPPKPGEPLRWFFDINPFRSEAQVELMVEGFHLLNAPLPTAQAPVEAAAVSRFVRLGEGWLVDYDGRRALLPDLKGLDDICRLIQSQGQEIHCLDLAGRLPAEHGGDAVLDDTARAAIKARLRDLQEEIGEAEDLNDAGRAEHLREEFETLLAALSQALGLGGRSRRLGSLAERARTTVTWRIRHATRRIETSHPELGRHFAHSLRTGTFCSYSPECAVAWRFAAGEERLAEVGAEAYGISGRTAGAARTGLGVQSDARNDR